MNNINPEITSSINAWSGQTSENVAWHVYQGDASSVLANLAENSFDCVVTSPPYYWLRDYKVSGQIGLEESVEEYVNAIVAVMDEVYRVLKPTGLLFLNLGDTYYSGKGDPTSPDRKNRKRRFSFSRAVDQSGGLGIGLRPKSMIGVPWRVAIQMTHCNWTLRSPIIWNRENYLQENSAHDRPHRTYEFIFMFAKGKKYKFDREALGNDEDIWTISTRPKPTNGIDTAPFPDELVRRCLAVGCPPTGSVLDPFAGSGTTLRVAVQSGRPATGIDLNPDFCQYIVQQLNLL